MRRGRPPAALYEAIDEDLADLFAQEWERRAFMPPSTRLPCVMRALRKAMAASREPRRRPARAVTRSNRLPALRAVLEAVAAAHDIEARHLTGGSQLAHVCAVRDEAAWLIRNTVSPRPSFALVGMALGGRDHSTVMASCARVEARMAREPVLRARLLARGGDASAVRRAA